MTNFKKEERERDFRQELANDLMNENRPKDRFEAGMTKEEYEQAGEDLFDRIYGRKRSGK